MYILGGLVTTAFGVVVCARPGVGAITIALLLDVFNLVYGTWALVQGIELRRTRKAAHSAVEGAGPSDPRRSTVHSLFRARAAPG